MKERELLGRDINGTPYEGSYLTKDGQNFYRKDTGETATLEELKARQIVPSTFYENGQLFIIPREIFIPKGD
jgi:hypothetical protein